MIVYFLLGLFVGMFCVIVSAAGLLLLYFWRRRLKTEIPRRRASPLSAEEERRVKIAQKEIENFFGYAGDVMPKPEDTV